MKKFLLLSVLMFSVVWLSKAQAQACSISSSTFRVSKIVRVGSTCSAVVEIVLTYTVSAGNKWINISLTHPVAHSIQIERNVTAGTYTEVIPVVLDNLDCNTPLDIRGSVALSNSTTNTGHSCQSQVKFINMDARVDATSICTPSPARISVTVNDNAAEPSIVSSAYFDLYYDNGLVAGELDELDTWFYTSPVSGTFPFNPGPVVVNSNSAVVIIATRVTTEAGIYTIAGIHSSTCGTLPVQFKSFQASRNRSTVSLTWVTASEQNNTGFEVQRLGGSGNWQTISFVATQATDGNSQTDISYSYTETNNIKGVSQYRLMQIDRDGKSKFSEIRAVQSEGQIGKTVIYPNPSRDGKVNVVFEDKKIVRDITLIDMNGRIIKQWKSFNSSNLQIENLTPGFYNLRVVTQETDEVMMEKIMVNSR